MYTANDFVDMDLPRKKAEFINAFIEFIDSGYKKEKLTTQILSTIIERGLFGHLIHDMNWASDDPNYYWDFFFSGRHPIRQYFIFVSETEWKDVEDLLVEYANSPALPPKPRYTTSESVGSTYLNLDDKCVLITGKGKGSEFLQHLADLLNSHLATERSK